MNRSRSDSERRARATEGSSHSLDGPDDLRRYGSASLDSLAELDDASCEAELRSLPGAGPKTARCVMMHASISRLEHEHDALLVAKRLGPASGADPEAGQVLHAPEHNLLGLRHVHGQESEMWRMPSGGVVQAGWSYSGRHVVAPWR